METVSYDLRGVVPASTATGVRLARLELPKFETSPLALVWYTVWNGTEELGVRIDMQKQAFLDDFVDVDRGKLAAEARVVVNFMASLKLRQTIAAAMATAAIPGLQRFADPWHPAADLRHSGVDAQHPGADPRSSAVDSRHPEADPWYPGPQHPTKS